MSFSHSCDELMAHSPIYRTFKLLIRAQYLVYLHFFFCTKMYEACKCERSVATIYISMFSPHFIYLVRKKMLLLFITNVMNFKQILIFY